ncbi:MAG: glycoside hydrolase family 9 protein [Clostridia bacterium]|nr:glycoside hydrolase family 9 protein [Clostridia bacterium]
MADRILTNHLGYVAEDRKRAVVQMESDGIPAAFTVKSVEGEVLFTGKPVHADKVARWKTGSYWLLDFDSVNAKGEVYIEAELEDGRKLLSQRFAITGPERDMRLINAGVCYFKSQRATGEWDAADRKAGFRDGLREGTQDVHGGWWDASGDVSKHLSHLSHSGWCNPQQTPMAVYALYQLSDVLSCDEQYGIMRRRILDEATYGADFLMRMRAPSGSFFRSVSRRESYRPVSDNRAIQHEFRHSSGQFEQGFRAPTEGQEQVTDEFYEVSLRSGGGMAIAALAIAARHPYAGGDFHTDDYLFAAKDAYRFLVRENARFTNDGTWNLIDTYCALMASVQLYLSSGEIGYLQDARDYASRLLSSMQRHGCKQGSWFSLEDGTPFYHASDEGLPLFAMALLAQAEPDRKRREALTAALRDAIACKREISEEENPFSYPRYLLKEGGETKVRFFFSHNTPAAPWWQGDNARICSLASAQLLASTLMGKDEQHDALFAAERTVDWILGMNPFDTSMMEGFGRNQIMYSFGGRYDFLGAPGGIVNGITSDPEDEEGIFFCMHPGEGNTVTDNWRWAEQWIPHAAWFLLAVGYAQKVRRSTAPRKDARCIVNAL